MNWCPGEPCVLCAWCDECQRVVGTPHLENCACSDTSGHHFCKEHVGISPCAITEGGHLDPCGCTPMDPIDFF